MERWHSMEELTAHWLRKKKLSGENDVTLFEDPRASEILMTKELQAKGEVSTFDTLSGAEFVPNLNLER